MTLDIILDVLSDGNWHTLNEISTKKPLQFLTMTQLSMILNLLSEYDFIELDQEVDQEGVSVTVKVGAKTLEFIRKIRWLEKIEETQNTKP